MHPKNNYFPKTLFLFFLIVLFAPQNSFANSLFFSAQSYFSFISSDGKTSVVTRPRIYKTTEETGEEAAVSNEAAVECVSLEREVFNLINKQRVAMGLPILKWSDEVAKIARVHSENMAKYRFFSHEDLDGLQVNDRADALGVSNWRSIGENIAYNQGYDHPGEFAVERWLQSPGHKENLLNNRWKETGIGVAVSKDKRYYFTQVFVLRR